MRARRRMMMAEDIGEFISQNLLLWFDGKEYLDASKWYPKILQNGELVKYSNYLSKGGSCSYNSTKGCFSKVANVAGYYNNGDSNFITSIKGSQLGDFTFLTHVDLTTVRDFNDEVILFGSTYTGGSGIGRGRLYLNSSGQLHFDINDGSSWINTDSTTSVPVNSHVINLAVVRNGSTMSFFVNGKKLGSDVSCSNLGYTYSCTTLNNYDRSNPSKTNALDYYSCAIYDRALASNEIASMCKYLNNRYNLKV